ncbi:hypothetical protein ACVPOW_14305 [Staphylococcus aureus]
MQNFDVGGENFTFRKIAIEIDVQNQSGEMLKRSSGSFWQKQARSELTFAAEAVQLVLNVLLLT